MDRQVFEFGPFQLDPRERLLLREGHPVPLTAKAFDTLLLLLQQAGHLVGKDELMSAVWGGAFVEEGSITVNIWTLRKALGDNGPEHKYIQTVAKRGYRFVGDWRFAGTVQSPPIMSAAVPDLQAVPAVELETSARQSSARARLRIAGLALLIFAAGIPVALVRKSSAAGPEIRSVAVLPFGVLNPSADRGNLSLRITESIITRLNATGRIDVRLTSAVPKFVDASFDALAVGRNQKVDAIVVGNIDTFPDRIRVTVQVVRVANGSLLWAGRFEHPSSNIVALEDEVAENVNHSILSVRRQVVPSARETHDAQTRQLYLEGRYFWNKRTEEGLRRSIESFERATKRDDRYAAAYAGLADSYTLLASYGVESAEKAYPSAKAAALKAIQLDDSLAEGHTSLGMVSFYYEWDWVRAEEEFKKSIELNPSYALAHTWYALDLAANGRFSEAQEEIQRAVELDPVSLSINTELGRVSYWSRQYERALSAYRKAIDLEPHFARAHTRLGMAYVAQRDYENGIREFQEARRLAGPDPYLDGLLGYTSALSGDTTTAQSLLESLTKKSQQGFVPAFSIALVCTGLGDRDRAIEWLTKAWQDRSTYMVYANVDPLLDPLRSDPRFMALLDRMGFAKAPASSY